MARSRSLGFFMRALHQARRANLAAEGRPMPVPEPHAGWSRRHFLRSAAAIAGAGLVAEPMPALGELLTAGRAPGIAICGGGLAGLNAALQLKDRGLVATVYEANTRLGGRVLSTTSGLAPGQVLDLGGSLINTDHADMHVLATRFGEPLFNRAEDAAAQPLPDVAYFFEGRMIPEAELADALRPMAGRIAHDSALLDADFERFAPRFDRLTVTGYLDRNAASLGAAYVRRLLEATIRTEYGVEPDEASALLLIFNLPTVDGEQVEVLGYSDEAFVVERGSGALIDGFARELSGQVQLGRRLVRLRLAHDGYRLTFCDRVGTSETVIADAVVIALPFTLLREVELLLPLPLRLRRFIEEGDLGRNEKVIAGFRERVWRSGGRFYAELWGDLGFSELWEETQRQPGRTDAALTFFLGGREAPADTARRAAALGGAFVRSLDRGQAVPGIAAAGTGQFLGTGWQRNPFSKGAYSTFRPGQLTRFARWFWIEGETPEDSQEVAFGNLVFAGEHLSDAFFGFMNGAAQTGRLAAAAIASRLAAEQAALQ